MRGSQLDAFGSCSLLWSKILQDIDLCERLERLWTTILRALYPTIGAADLARRFLEPWRRFVEEQLPLNKIESAFIFEPADLLGWQSLAFAIVIAAQADFEPRTLRDLSKELSLIFLQAVNDRVPNDTRPLRLIRNASLEEGDPGLLERWSARGNLVGSSRVIRALGEKCARAARDRYPVLLVGETGCGKEVAARLLHQLSNARGEFVPVNCAALPETLVECELFGHVRGAFTGASTQRQGLIQAAHGGTLFLDEISELPLPQQAKLLRVLQDGLVRPLGSTRYQPVDVRVIGATNHDLKRILNQGQLRRDLYYRLAVHEIRIPPLREHPEDVPELVACFLARWRQTNPRLAPPTLSPEALEFLGKARWPGNVRQLEHIVYRLATNGPGEAIAAAEAQRALEVGEQQLEIGERHDHDELSLAAVEQHAVEKALAASQGNKAGAARLLGITRKALYHKIRRYGIAFIKK